MKTTILILLSLCVLSDNASAETKRKCKLIKWDDGTTTTVCYPGVVVKVIPTGAVLSNQ